jgi:hypothetical protein
MSRFQHILGVILDPTFWLRGHRVDHAYSDRLDVIISRIGRKDSDLKWKYGAYRLEIGPHYEIQIWLQNYPWSYGTECSLDVLPRRKTAIKLRQLMMELHMDKVNAT